MYGFVSGADIIKVSAADALGRVRTNAKGDFVLQLSENNNVTFRNASAPITADDFII